MQYSGEATCLNQELIHNYNTFNQMIFAWFDLIIIKIIEEMN